MTAIIGLKTDVKLALTQLIIVALFARLGGRFLALPVGEGSR
jgi:hypothetical protein